MHNELFTLFGLTVHGYGLMIGLGIAASLMLSSRRARQRGLSEDTVSTMTIVAVLTGYLGSKLLYCLVNFDRLLADPLSVLGSEGWVVYGGILGGVAGCWLYCRRKGLNFLAWSDLLLPGVALAQSLGRVGCFLAGCCYGRETASRLGVIFPAGSLAPAGVRLLPTQLFSAAGDLAICLALLAMEKRNDFRGRTTAMYLLLYSAGRFALEFFRGDFRGSVGALSVSQFISLFVLVWGLWLYRRCGRKAA